MVRKCVAGVIALVLGFAGALVVPSAARAEAGVGPWVLREAANLQLWQSVTYGGGMFVAVSADGDDQVMTSAEGEKLRSDAAAGPTTAKATVAHAAKKEKAPTAKKAAAKGRKAAAAGPSSGSGSTGATRKRTAKKA